MEVIWEVNDLAALRRLWDMGWLPGYAPERLWSAEITLKFQKSILER